MRKKYCPKVFFPLSNYRSESYTNRHNHMPSARQQYVPLYDVSIIKEIFSSEFMMH
jgi:hypothetical protein